MSDIVKFARHMHVCQIIKGLGRGGAERLLLSVVQNFPSGCKFTIVYFYPVKDHLVEDFKQLGCDVILFPAGNQVSMLLQIPALVRLLRNRNINLIHAHLPWAGVISRIAGRWAGIPVIYTEHNLFSRYHFITKIVSRLTYHLQKMVLAVSEPVAVEARKLSNVPVSILTNAVDTSEFSPERFNGYQLRRDLAIPQDALIIGTVTALTAQKRIDRWISIAIKISELRPDVFFVIAGDGVLRKELAKQAAPLMESGKILFSGRLSDPVKWLACMDVFMMTSDFEGLPIALLEAMSMRCIPVCTPAGGISSVLSDSINGLLIPHEEKPKVTAAKIVEMLNNPSLREKLSFNARDHIVRHHHITRLTAELSMVYGSAAI